MDFVIPVVGESDGASAGAGVPSHGWRLQSDSEVMLVSPTDGAASSNISNGSSSSLYGDSSNGLELNVSGALFLSERRVQLTAQRAVSANQIIVFNVTRVMNPSSVTGAANVVVETKDQMGGMIDGPTNVATDVITAGALASPMSWVAGTRTPGVTDNATLSFNVTGSVVSGGKFVVVLPGASAVGCTSSWSMPAVPSVEVSSPG